MYRLMHCGALAVLLMLSACTPESKEQYENEPITPRAERLFAAYVNHGLDEADRSLTELEQVAGDGAGESDPTVKGTVADLRDQFEQLSEQADTLVGTDATTNDEQKLALRENLLDLTRTVERTRLELTEGPTEFLQAAELRLGELDKRIYALKSGIENAGLSSEFASTLSELGQLDKDASEQILQLENASSEAFARLRGNVVTDLSLLSVRLTEAESEYETAAGTDMVKSTTGMGNLDSMSDESGSREPIDEPPSVKN